MLPSFSLPAAAISESLHWSLNSSNGLSWLLTCTDDPKESNVLPLNNSTAPAIVPGCVLSDLRDVLPDPFLKDNSLLPVFEKLEFAAFSYTTNFIVKASNEALFAKHAVYLVFDCLDTVATVFLNYVQLTSTENAFHRHEVLLSNGVLQPGSNTLTVNFPSIRGFLENKKKSHNYREWNDFVGGISRCRTPQYKAGWDWGPRLLTSGITGSVFLQVVPAARITDVTFVQEHSAPPGGPVTVSVSVCLDVRVALSELLVACELNGPGLSAGVRVALSEHENSDIVEGGCVFSGELLVSNPYLWWPNGYGQQHLYEARVECTSGESGVSLDSRTTSIGLRTIQLVTEETSADVFMCGHGPDGPVPERSGNIENEDVTCGNESFMFEVNGRRIFAKGANFIPVHAIYSEASRADYELLITAAQEANMNMLRVWGGGIYEKDVFYDLCDARGILVWQDFMFSCSLYPGDVGFLASCTREARHQVARLRNRACLALWCGNNELEQVPREIARTAETQRAYDTLFNIVLARVVRDDPGPAPYWPSSPHNPAGYAAGCNSAVRGDTHYWEVWHARKPVAHYRRHASRFCSEFGMQSFLSEAGARAFVPRAGGCGGGGGDGGGARLNIFGRALEAHQKNAGGNLIVQEYCSRLFEAPAGYAGAAYQSQLNQAECTRAGIEHFRRSWPYCAGALYWQLNDCWPCFSWSSIEFGGHWKALHYAARRAFAPLLLSAVHHGSEAVAVGNHTRFSEDTGLVSLYASWDGDVAAVRAWLQWEVFDIPSGAAVERGGCDVLIPGDSSDKIATVDLRAVLPNLNPKDVVLRGTLTSSCRKWKSNTTSWLCSPRLCELGRPLIQSSVAPTETSSTTHQVYQVQLETNKFAPFVQLSWEPSESEFANHGSNTRYSPPPLVRFSDNYFDLYPGDVILVSVTVPVGFNGAVRTMSLFDSYM